MVALEVRISGRAENAQGGGECVASRMYRSAPLVCVTSSDG